MKIRSAGDRTQYEYSSKNPNDGGTTLVRLLFHSARGRRAAAARHGVLPTRAAANDGSARGKAEIAARSIDSLSTMRHTPTHTAQSRLSDTAARSDLACVHPHCTPQALYDDEERGFDAPSRQRGLLEEAWAHRAHDERSGHNLRGFIWVHTIQHSHPRAFVVCIAGVGTLRARAAGDGLRTASDGRAEGLDETSHRPLVALDGSHPRHRAHHCAHGRATHARRDPGARF